MVDIEVGEFTARRRFDPVTAAAVVLTVDAALFLVLAVVGLPFVLYIFGDDDTGTWQHMAPLVTWWAVAAVLGAASTTAVVRTFGRGGEPARKIGRAAARGPGVAVVVLIITTLGRTPALAVFGSLLAIANVAAVRVLAGPADVAVEEAAPVIELIAEEEDEDIPVEPRITVELPGTGPGRAVPSAARRRLRQKAAMQTHAGVRLSRRPRR